MKQSESIAILDEIKGYFNSATIDAAIDMAIAAMTRGCPCNLCVYYPPSSFDGKPCGMCPAEGRRID